MPRRPNPTVKQNLRRLSGGFVCSRPEIALFFSLPSLRIPLQRRFGRGISNFREASRQCGRNCETPESPPLPDFTLSFYRRVTVTPFSF